MPPPGLPCAPKEIPKEKPDVKAGRDTEAGFYKEVGVMTNKVRKREGEGQGGSGRLLHGFPGIVSSILSEN